MKTINLDSKAKKAFIGIKARVGKGYDLVDIESKTGRDYLKKIKGETLCILISGDDHALCFVKANASMTYAKLRAKAFKK